MGATETSLAISTLALALRALASATSDASAGSTASYYANLLEATDPTQGEELARQVRDQLNSPKTDFTDGLDRSEAFLLARHLAYDAAQAAVNHYVGLRRPDLASMAGKKA